MQRIISRFPMTSNSLLFSVLYGTGDLTRQILQRHAASEPVKASSDNKVLPQPRLYSGLDFKSALQMAIVGGVGLGPFNFVWLRRLDRLIPGTKKTDVAKKVLLDQAFAGPVGILIFYTGIGYLQKINIMKEIKEKFVRTYVTGCVFWPCAQTVNFSLVPSPLRPAYVGCVAFIWTNILSYYKSQKS